MKQERAGKFIAGWWKGVDCERMLGVGWEVFSGWSFETKVKVSGRLKEGI